MVAVNSGRDECLQQIGRDARKSVSEVIKLNTGYASAVDLEFTNIENNRSRMERYQLLRLRGLEISNVFPERLEFEDLNLYNAR